jgi:hypothetical protein
MSTNRTPPLDECEWDAQERALHAVRTRDPAALDADGESYRMLAESIDSMPLSGPPADFVARVTAHVAARESGFERVLSRTLFGVAVAAAIAVAAFYGETFARLLAPVMSRGTTSLALTGVGCAVLSWLANRLRDSRHGS